ncbi:hypothetical protein ACFYZJ_07055 [Streptomyces sp. NPDC001848]|uniref:hypothetical protein n=1 Tax=Streptomyces sp. NPDC001848 TaxID=3364618 RepID=UPI00367BDF43
MSEADAPEGHHHGVRGLVQRMNEHHRDAVRRREEEELERAAEDAGFDLGADMAHPTVGPAAVGYDVEADLGLDNEPPELRR